MLGPSGSVASIYIISSWDLILWLYLESDDCWILSSNTYLNDHVRTMDWVPRRVCQRKPIDFVSCIKILASQYTYSSGFLLIYLQWPRGLSSIFHWVLFSFYRTPEEGTKLALNLHSWKMIYLKIISLFLSPFWCWRVKNTGHVSALFYQYWNNLKPLLISLNIALV